MDHVRQVGPVHSVLEYNLQTRRARSAAAFALLPLLSAGPACAQTPVLVASVDTFTEGPVFDAQGNLYFSHRNGVLKRSPQGVLTHWIDDPEAGFHGHKILPDGTHLVCAAKKGAIWKLDASGKILGVATSESEGQPLRAPNDLTLDSLGGVYFTDPGGSRAAPIGTVHYIDRHGKTTTIAGGLRVPNGLVLSPDGRFLYVAETVPNRILRYPVVKPGQLGPMQVFAELPGREGHEAAPDGLAIDTNGNLYVAHLGTGSVLVLDPAGKLKRRLDGGNYDVSNLAFGGPGRSRLYVTGSAGYRANTEGRVYRLEIKAHRARRRPSKTGRNPQRLRAAEAPLCASLVKAHRAQWRPSKTGRNPQRLRAAEAPLCASLLKGVTGRP